MVEAKGKGTMQTYWVQMPRLMSVANSEHVGRNLIEASETSVGAEESMIRQVDVVPAPRSADDDAETLDDDERLDPDRLLAYLGRNGGAEFTKEQVEV